MKTLNTYLIRSVLFLCLIQYGLMYWTGLSDADKWRVFDIGNACIRFVVILYLFFMFKLETFNYEKQVNYRTIKAVIVFEGYNLLGEVLDVNKKGDLFEVIFALFLMLTLPYQLNLIKRLKKKKK